MKYIVLSLALACATALYAGEKDQKCGKSENRQLYKGEKGGCFYKIRKNGKLEKVYVDKSKCNC